jgi:hypothetical protein
MATNLPETKLTGVNAPNTKYVLVSGLTEVFGQVRFGDGTDVELTITETDRVIAPDGDQVDKFIWSGSKRRGVDRRTIHELRDRYWSTTDCFVPVLCCQCPVCWLYGFTGTTRKGHSFTDINAKSRVLYASSVSIEDVPAGQNRHNRNQVDEKTQTTAGAAGIHKEQVIVAGVHFPIYTSILHALDWEVGAFAHALLENLNQNRYTARSAMQGGIKWTLDNAGPVLVVDESADGVFPLPVPKVPGWETDYSRALDLFRQAVDRSAIKQLLESKGFAVAEEGKDKALLAKGKADDKVEVFRVHLDANIITVMSGQEILMTRYWGERAQGYLLRHQLEWQNYLQKLGDARQFQDELEKYVDAIRREEKATAPSE